MGAMKPTTAVITATPAQRALWTFLLCTLVAPFLAALIILLSSIISGWLGKGPASLLALDRAGQLGWAAQKAIETYVWSAIPAAIAGAGLAGTIYVRGTAPWLVAASLAAIVVSCLSLVSGGMMAQHLTPMAFIAAVVGIAMWWILRRAGILVD
jgi:hypothetical protein